MTPDELDEVMKNLAAKSLQFIEANGLKLPGEGETERIFQEYAGRIIEIDGLLPGSGKETVREHFAGCEAADIRFARVVLHGVAAVMGWPTGVKNHPLSSSLGADENLIRRGDGR